MPREPSDRPERVAPTVRLRRTGPYASLLELEAPASPATSRRVAELRVRLARHAPPEVQELVPGLASLLIEHRPTLTPRAVRRWLGRAADDAGAAPGTGRRTLRVAYGLDADVAALEAATGRPFAELARLHAEHEATVAVVGAAPGFPWLLGLPEELRLPRRDAPRAPVPAGAVVIAGDLGGVHPTAAAAGDGWVLGRSDAPLFEPWREPPAWLAAGDRVRFEAVDAADLRAPSEAPPAPVEVPDGPSIEVLEAVPGAASLQAAPRRGGGHLGLARAGALDPLARDAANAMVGNEGAAPVLETIGQPVALRADASLLAAVAGGGVAVALDGRQVPTWTAFAWPAGATLELVPDRQAPGRTALLAVRGALHGERWRGSLSTDVRARAGGSRRWLVAGDRIGVAGLPARDPLPHPGRPRYGARVALRLHPGPQYDARAFETLIGHAYRLADADRTGARLDGPPVAHPRAVVDADGSSAGAVQTPPDGGPIVLLSDRGRVGRHAKPAVADPRDLWQLAQARPGDEVWLLDARGDDVPVEPLDFGP